MAAKQTLADRFSAFVKSLGKNARGIERIQIVACLDAVVSIALRKGAAPPILVEPLKFNPAGIQKIFIYGLQKYLRDGAGGKESKKKADKGRLFTQAELNANAVENAAHKLAGLYSGDLSTRVSGLSTYTRELRGMLCKQLAKILDADGKPLGGKGIPSAVAAGSDPAAMMMAAQAAGLKEAVCQKLSVKAQTVADIKDDDDDLEVDVD